MLHKSETQHLLKNFFSFVTYNSTLMFTKFVLTMLVNFFSLCHFFQEHGFIYQYLCVYTLPQNGLVECKHCHIVDTGHALHFEANLPLQFWGKCVLTAIHIVNRLPIVVLSCHTPFEKLYTKSPTYSHICIFGCLAYDTNVHLSHNFALRAQPCAFLVILLVKKHIHCTTLLSTKSLLVATLFFM